MKNLIHLDVNLPVKTPKSYPILIASGLLHNAASWGIDFNQIKQIVVITDKTVSKLYGSIIINTLNEAFDFNTNIPNPVMLLEIIAGEESKVAATKEWLESEMLKQKLGRRTLLIALGGGVVGDIAGFVAATYMRGIDYIQIPTTLLAMVDSSVGGKTAIDTPWGKNLIGAFWQPTAVIMDLDCLDSLPKIHLIAGLVEAIKIFLTCNAAMFDYIKNNITEILCYNKEVLQYIIVEAVKLKSQIVRKDETEENLRMVLNFGHTIGHGLELVANYKLMHGYAVAFGIVIEAKIAVNLGKLKLAVVSEIVDLFKQLDIFAMINESIGYDIMHDIKNNPEMVDAILTAILQDKKNQAGNIYCVLLEDIGKVYKTDEGLVASPVSQEVIRQALNYE